MSNNTKETINLTNFTNAIIDVLVFVHEEDLHGAYTAVCREDYETAENIIYKKLREIGPTLLNKFSPLFDVDLTEENDSLKSLKSYLVENGNIDESKSNIVEVVECGVNSWVYITLNDGDDVPWKVYKISNYMAKPQLIYKFNTEEQVQACIKGVESVIS